MGSKDRVIDEETIVAQESVINDTNLTADVLKLVVQLGFVKDGLINYLKTVDNRNGTGTIKRTIENIHIDYSRIMKLATACKNPVPTHNPIEDQYDSKKINK